MFAKLLQKKIHAGNGYALKTVASLFLDESQQPYWGFGLKITETLYKIQDGGFKNPFVWCPI